MRRIVGSTRWSKAALSGMRSKPGARASPAAMASRRRAIWARASSLSDSSKPWPTVRAAKARLALIHAQLEGARDCGQHGLQPRGNSSLCLRVELPSNVRSELRQEVLLEAGGALVEQPRRAPEHSLARLAVVDVLAHRLQGSRAWGANGAGSSGAGSFQ